MYIHFNVYTSAAIVAKQRSGARLTMGRAKQKKKKDAQLVLRLNHEMRDRFIDACQDLDTTAAREVRRYIKKFLKRYENGEFEE